MNRSGLQMYSKAWMDENATEVPAEMHSMIAEICESYQLGDATDPNILWKIIKKGIRSFIQKISVEIMEEIENERKYSEQG